MVFYRKYRPQKIQELDSQSVRETLFSILSRRDSIPHAFLFSGSKGLGKTSAARIVAKVVNCEKLDPKRSTLNAKIEPCNKCSQCLSITDGTNLDVLEIDAASNRGIDEVRDLREKIKLAPLSARTKIYIVDEAHMLTREAFNALLKTLEEPPKHIIFILCTTEPEKLPETIASRCFPVNFKRAKKEEIERALSRIIKMEKIKIEKEATAKIVQLAGGSFRDAVKILEHLRALAGRKKITQEVLEKEYHSEQQLVGLLEWILKKETKNSLSALEGLVREGVTVKVLNEQLIYSLHDLLLNKLGISEEELELESELEIEDLKRLITLLERAALEAKTAVVPQLPLELAIIEWGEMDGAGRLPHPISILEELIKKVKPYNHSVAGVLRGCKIKEFDGKKLLIETHYKFHKERLEEIKIKQLIEKVGSEIAGNPVIVSILHKGG